MRPGDCAVLCAAVVFAIGCGPDWDALDPSLGGTPGQGGASTTTVGSGGFGGASASSSATSAGGTLTTSSSVSSSVGTGGTGNCPVNDGNDCTDDKCINGNPTNPPSVAGTPCTQNGGKVCDGAGSCVACNVATDCGTDGTCGMFKCSQQHVCGGVFTQSGKACTDSGGTVCDGSGHCVQCISNLQCTAPETCGGSGVANTCACGMSACASLGKTCGTVCTNMVNCNDGMKDGTETDVDCGGSGTCNLQCGVGKACAVATDCQSGFCIDGVCCSTACTASCFACNLTGSVGTCTPVAKLMEDPNPASVACVAPKACDGTGQCKLATGQACTVNSDCASNSCLNLVCQ